MGIVIPPEIVSGLVSGAAQGIVGLAGQGGGVLANITAALGLAKAPAATVQTVPTDTALSMASSAWAKLTPDVQQILVAANPHGIHLTAG
jgi:hypothetical protein